MWACTEFSRDDAVGDDLCDLVGGDGIRREAGMTGFFFGNFAVAVWGGSECALGLV